MQSLAHIFVLGLVTALTFGTPRVSPLLEKVTILQNVEEESPFLWGGKEYADRSSGIADGVYDQYGNIPFDYTNASACLVGNPVSEDQFESTDLIWGELETVEHVEVCLFRVIARLREKDKISAWLTRQGWAPQEVFDSSSTAHLMGSPGPVLQVGFYWNAEEIGAPFGSDAAQQFYFRYSRSSKITINLDDDRGLLWLTFNNQSIWSK